MEFDEHLWEFCKDCRTDKSFLHWKGNGDVCVLPEGVTDCSGMFSDLVIPETLRFEGFDKGTIASISHMFKGAKLPDNFRFGDWFDCSNVTDMSHCFYLAKLGKGFRMKGDFSNVRDVLLLFGNARSEGDCVIDAGFPECKDFFYMFRGFSGDLELTEKFCVEQASNFANMFLGYDGNLVFRNAKSINTHAGVFPNCDIPGALTYDKWCLLNNREHITYDKYIIDFLSKNGKDGETSFF